MNANHLVLNPTVRLLYVFRIVEDESTYAVQSQEKRFYLKVNEGLGGRGAVSGQTGVVLDLLSLCK